MNLNSKYYFDNYGYRVGDTRCRKGKCCNLISVGCVQWDFPSTELYNKKETLEEILRKIEELLLQDNSNFPIKNIGNGYEVYAGITDETNSFKTFTSSNGVIITTTPTTINIGFDTSTLPQTGVTSVAMTAPTGFTVGGSPITSTGIISLNYALGYKGYTTIESNKLVGIEDGAQVNVQPDWNATSGAAQILNKPTLATVATTGDYNDLINLPTPTTGTVTSVALTTPTGLQVTGSPITTSGTLALAFQIGYSIPTNSSQSNWDTAYGWGNHADEGYLTTETDPTVPSHVKGITTTNINNWNSAFGWGNHASAGYLTSFTETDPTVPSWAKQPSKPTYGWVEITGKPTFHAVATSGSYNDLSNLPTIPAQVNLLQGTNVTITGTYPNLTINSTASGGGDTNIIESISRNGVPITPDGSKNVDIPIFSTSGAGLVPERVGAVATKYLREDGTWITPTNTTYTALTLPVLNTGTSSTASTISAQVLTNWLNGKISTAGFSGSYNDLTNKPTIPSTPNLSQVLAVGNTASQNITTTGDITAEIVNTQTINMDGDYSYIATWDGYIEDDGGTIKLHHNKEIGLSAPILKLKGITFPNTAGTSGQVLTTNGTNAMSWTTPSGGSYTAGTGIDITSNIVSVKQATSSERGGTKIWKGTQAAYNSLLIKDPDTLYFIEDSQSAEIAVFSGMVEALTPVTGGTIIQLAANPSLAIWDRTYDWVLSWKDADGLHTLEDYQGTDFNNIKKVWRTAGGKIYIEITHSTALSVLIPDNAKLTLHLSDDAPQEPGA